jgi:hypothetical protein
VLTLLVRQAAQLAHKADKTEYEETASTALCKQVGKEGGMEGERG